MIVDYNKSYKEYLFNILNNKPLQNVYLLIDAEMYGFEANNVKTWIIEDAGHKCQCIIYKYYNSIQLFETIYLDDIAVNELSDFLIIHRFNMISGTSEIISKLYERLSNLYKKEIGYIFKCHKKTIRPICNFVEMASVKQMKEIAELICTDINIGGHYQPDALTAQLKERIIYKNCRNVIYTIDNKIVSHMATYAETDKLAVLGGLITEQKYRGKGIGKIVLQHITAMTQIDNKQPILYCYEPAIYSWYESMGWVKETKCGKLEKIN